MDATALIQSLDSAKAAELAVLERLGNALAAGDEDKVMNLQRELRDAEARTAELDRAASAINAATQAAERARIAREAREAAAARVHKIQAAREAHEGLLRTAAKIDRAQAALDSLLGEMDEKVTAFLAEHSAIGMRAQARSWLTMNGWVRETIARMKSQSHRTVAGALHGQLLTFTWSGKPLAKAFPSFESLFVLRPDDVVTGEKEAA